MTIRYGLLRYLLVRSEDKLCAYYHWPIAYDVNSVLLRARRRLHACFRSWIDDEISVCALDNIMPIRFPYGRLSFTTVSKRSLKSRHSISRLGWNRLPPLGILSDIFSDLERESVPTIIDRPHSGELHLLTQYCYRILLGQVDPSVVVGQTWASLPSLRRGSWGEQGYLPWYKLGRSRSSCEIASTMEPTGLNFVPTGFRVEFLFFSEIVLDYSSGVRFTGWLNMEKIFLILICHVHAPNKSRGWGWSELTRERLGWKTQLHFECYGADPLAHPPRSWPRRVQSTSSNSKLW